VARAGRGRRDRHAGHRHHRRRGHAERRLPGPVPDHPFPGTSAACDQAIAASIAAGSKNFPGTEVEPWVSADPTNPNHLIAAFQQDRWNDGGANGLTHVLSNDGGQSWQLSSAQPQFSICEGATPGAPGHFSRTSDPW